MRRLSQKRLLRLASVILTGLTVVFGILWVVRGLRPAIACGVLDALGSGDWSAAYACVDQADYEALLFVVTLAASFVAWMASRGAPDTPIGEYNPTPDQHARNREGMIERVSRIVEDRLDQSLYQAILLSLGMTWRAAVPRPGSLSLHRVSGQEQDIPDHIPIVHLFEGAQHRLLILGEPGAGKTTMVLDLARSLLKQARDDSKTLIPVILNLSSLAEPEQSIEDWLVSELSRSYVVPENLARYWLDHDELALLLDGLDEVRAECRANAVEKLNRFRSQHLAPWLVVCCRQSEYAELTAAGSALHDVDAIVLRPLTGNQTEDYLVGLDGPEPQQLWDALQRDEALLALADTPLMLNVMLLAADQLDWDALPSDRGPEAVRSNIYDAYIRSMLARPRSADRRYPDDKTLHWLHWLARKMVAQGQAVFLLETMRRSWFNRPWQPFIWIVVFGLFWGLFWGLLFGLVGRLLVGLWFGLWFGLFFGRTDMTVAEQIHFRLNRGRLLFWLLFWLLLGPLGALLGVLLVGLVGGLDVGLIYETVVVALLLGLVGGLLVGLLVGLLEQSTTFEETYLGGRPNAAIRQSLRNGLLVGLLVVLLFGLFFVLLFGLFWGLLVGLFWGLLVGLFFGGVTVTKHYTLRLVLFLDGSTPLNYVRFLDYCVDRVLLRRVGGGYMFIHRTMMEHIAGLDLEKWKEQPDSP